VKFELWSLNCGVSIEKFEPRLLNRGVGIEDFESRFPSIPESLFDSSIQSITHSENQPQSNKD
jgi:hypothetical protein